MVHDTSSSSDEIANPPQIIETPPKGIPIGKYRLVGWAVDTTGRRLIDEIVQIAAYTPNSSFSQYIMPFSDLNSIYSRKHNIRVFNTARYRRLKDLRTGQFLKTKSEISALNDFIEWLETAKGETDGVILIFHEVRKSTPGMLLEALKKNNLLDRFDKVCKGFANGYSIATAKCQNSIKTYNLRVMGKVLLGRENTDFSNAVVRAAAVYDIAVHLAQGEREELNQAPKISTGTEPELMALICPFTNSLSDEEEETKALKVLLERQNTFRPVFGALLKASSTERHHANHLRRLLAENNINYDLLKEAYEKGAKDALDKILKQEIANANEADLTELLEILDCFFDPEKEPIRPKAPFYRFPRRPRPKSFSKNNRSNSRGKKNPSESGKGDESIDKVESNENSGCSDNAGIENAPVSAETSPQKQQETQQPAEVPAN
ncbi:maternal protein exuperantia [Anthonomus grandis grandis]|uniref:maternal protein exuperantia n=1 Tax=Anthonomus grandis grandis TaxID=2921223 RepID=UPI002165DB83|nr:maternal protein exuperantia [Anthonomus grandis grandis]XP_050305863.1 maternal protein exuperantia [Anthonomus grandis grandis]XP_050305864.1 maternal protein exuperantia [Anthonomus grandis grandis]